MPVPAWESPRYAVLFEHAPGQVPRGPLAPGLAREYGRLLARLHLAGDRYRGWLARPALDLGFLIDRPLAALTTHWAGKSAELRTVRSIAERIRPHLETLPTEPPLYGPCHGDFILANSHATTGGQITFFDFDHCGLGWRAYDIALFLQESGRWEPSAGRAFLEGYQGQRALSQRELESLPFLQAARALFFLGAHASRIDEWGSARLSPERIEAVMAEATAALDRTDRMSR